MEVVDDDPVTSQEGAKHGGLEHGTRSADPHASSVVWRQSAATHPETRSELGHMRVRGDTSRGNALPSIELTREAATPACCIAAPNARSTATSTAGLNAASETTRSRSGTSISSPSICAITFDSSVRETPTLSMTCCSESATSTSSSAVGTVVALALELGAPSLVGTACEADSDERPEVWLIMASRSRARLGPFCASAASLSASRRPITLGPLRGVGRSDMRCSWTASRAAPKASAIATSSMLAGPWRSESRLWCDSRDSPSCMPCISRMDWRSPVGDNSTSTRRCSSSTGCVWSCAGVDGCDRCCNFCGCSRRSRQACCSSQRGLG